MRRKIIAGNWKMHGFLADLDELIKIAEFAEKSKSEIIVCPPITLMSKLSTSMGGNSFYLGAQNCHYNDYGAHTGEISPKMLNEIGLSYVIIGHSERRNEHSETNNILRKKISAAWRNDLSTIVCVGESAKTSRDGLTTSFIRKQLLETLPDRIELEKLVIAYEPIWAIGTGTVPSLQQIEDIHFSIRQSIRDSFGETIANALRIIYGGSLTQENSMNIFKLPNVDGGLVGGASLTHKSFTSIIFNLENNL